MTLRQELSAEQDIESTPRPRRLLQALLVFAIGASVLVAASSFMGGFGRAWSVMGNMDPRWLAAGAVCVLVAYGVLAMQVRWVVRGGADAKRVAPVRTALVLFGLGSILPAAPLEGFALAGAALRRRRLDGRRMAMLFGFTQWFSVRGLLALAAVDVLVALRLSHIPGPYRVVALAGVVATLIFLAVTGWLATRRRCAELVALVLLRVRHWRDHADARTRRADGAAWHAEAMRVLGRGLDRRVLLLLSVAAWATEGLCLACVLHATGAQIGLDVLFLAYTAGVLASMLPLVPGGVGIVETVTPLVLHAYGVPLPAAFAAVLSFRVLASILPALAGALALVGLRVGAASG